MLVVFSKHMGQNAVMEPLVFEPDKNLQMHLAGFLNEKVFIDDDDGEWHEGWWGRHEETFQVILIG